MSSRADDLTADLLHDLTAEQESTPVAPAQPEQAPEHAPDGAAFVDTDFYLAPRSWKRPGIGRDGGALAFRAGPVQVRIGRRH